MSNVPPQGPVESMLRHLLEEARDIERQRIAAWLLKEAIGCAQRDEVDLARYAEKLAHLVKENALELSSGGEG